MSSTERPFTVGSQSFDPEKLFDPTNLNEAKAHLEKNELELAICKLFGLLRTDSYVYHATVAVVLPQVQAAVDAGSIHGLHDWYLDNDGLPTGHPPSTDICAYISIFDPSKSSANTLKSFAANAKKDSIRSSIAQYLISKRHLDRSVTVSKRKAPHINPYHIFWSWSCHNLEYAGPNPNNAHVKTSHHVLPIFMHHFGCVCPSFEALEVISRIAAGRTILDIGSGNGYWTLMLRRHGAKVIAIDNQQSSYRTCWIGDTVREDGEKFIKSRSQSAKDDVLLLVYPVVSADFTKRILQTFQGDTICIAGTQNGNGYTGFKDVVVDEWMNQNKPEFDMMARIPLPSFAGKDDALFVFVRKIA